jgi:outer membrane murein-binding lipoprotein Lpp
MSYASYEEMEMAVAEEFEEKINELEERVVELAKEVDALKHEVDVAEGEAEHWEAEYDDVAYLRAWMLENHPEILTTYEVTQRMED